MVCVCNKDKNMSSGREKKAPDRVEALIVQLLTRNGLFVQRELNFICQQFGLNSNQFSVLNEIILRGPLSQKVLCRRLLYEKSNISKIVKSLLEKELIYVVPAPEDRRLTLLIETQPGVELWKKCRPSVNQACKTFMSTFSENEMHHALELLKRLEDECKSKAQK